MDNMQLIIEAIIVVALIFIVLKLFKTPLRLLFKLLINTIGGFITLMIINFFGSFIGITIGVNWLNAVIIAILGMPGVGLLLILKWLMII